MDGGSGIGTPTNILTNLNLRQRREVAAWLFRVRLPIANRKQPMAHEMAQRDLAIWLIRQPTRFGEIPTLRQLEPIIGIDHRRLQEITARLIPWDSTKSLETLILGRFVGDRRRPFNEEQALELYGRIRVEGSWPWKRACKTHDQESGRFIGGLR